MSSTRVLGVREVEHHARANGCDARMALQVVGSKLLSCRTVSVRLPGSNGSASKTPGAEASEQ